MEVVKDVEKSKWISLIVFMIINFGQILFVSLIYLDETTIQIVGIDFSKTDPLVSASLFIGISLGQVVLLYIMTLRMQSGSKMVQIYPSPKLKQRTFECKYSPKEIVDWTMDSAQKSGVSISKVYVMPSPLPNAFTFSLPFIGASIAVHSNLLDVLQPEEVQAIISHEVGHIKNRDSLVSIFTRMPSFFVDIVYLYIYIRLGLGIATSLLVNFDLLTAGVRIIVLLAFFFLSRLVVIVSKRFIKKSARQAELLADYHAATLVGHGATINGLIRLGQRVEAITALVGEIRWLESFNPERVSPLSSMELQLMIATYPLDGIDERNAREMAPWVFLTTRLRNLRDVYGVALDDSQIEVAISSAVKDLLAKRAKEMDEFPDRTAGKVIDWRESDLDGDRRLSEEELTELLKVLRENPTKLLFENELGLDLYAIDHPDFRRRVLFVAECFGM